MSITITGEQWHGLLETLAKRPADVFLSPVCRQYLAKSRWENSPQKLDIALEPSTGVMEGTIRHNSYETRNNVFGSHRRSNRLLGALSGLDPVYSCAPALIGKLYLLMASGA